MNNQILNITMGYSMIKNYELLRTSKTILCFILAISILMPACKKGENDPFLSLKTRKARITGQWKPTKIEATETKGDSTFTWSLKGGTMYVKLNGSDYTSFSLDETLNIEKDGTFNRYMNQGGYKYTANGVWYFGGKNKEEDLKNKELVVFAYKNEKYDPGNTYSYSGLNVDNPYRIDQLKNEEMVLKAHYSYYDWDGGKITGTETLTYEKEK